MIRIEERTVSRTTENEGLTLGYRFMWRLRYVGMHVFGPAQLGDSEDPHARMRRERQRKVAAARQARGVH